MRYKFALSPFILSFSPSVALVSGASYIDDRLVLGIYQSYISPKIISEASSEFSLKTIYFENDKEALSGLQTGAFDIAIVSSSTLEEGIANRLVSPIKWSKLLNENNKKSSAKPIFSSIVHKIVGKRKNKNLLAYGIPYFLSYLLFIYRSSSDRSLVNGTAESSREGRSGQTLNGKSWRQLFSSIQSSSDWVLSSPLHPRLGLIEDEYTLFLLSTLLGQNGSKLRDQEISISEAFTSLSYINKGQKRVSRPFFFTPDSTVLSEMFSSGEIDAALIYNGDALNIHQEERLNGRGMRENKNSKGEVRIFSPSPSIWLLDMVVISPRLERDKEEKVYSFLKKLLFEEPDGQSQSVASQWVWENFAFTQYTPVLDSMARKLQKLFKESKTKKAEKEKWMPDFKVDRKSMRILFGGRNTRGKIEVEKGLSDISALNLSLAFQKWKNSI